MPDINDIFEMMNFIYENQAILDTGAFGINMDSVIEYAGQNGMKMPRDSWFGEKELSEIQLFFSDEKNQELFVDVINGLDKNPLQYKFDKDDYRKWDILENSNNYKALISWYQKAYAAYYANRVKENPKLMNHRDGVIGSFLKKMTL